MIAPLQFQPVLRPKVWGGTQLRERFGKPTGKELHCGESWEVSGLPECPTLIDGGEFSGLTLNEFWKQHQGLLDPQSQFASEEFPLLVKWLDCEESLSVQVHPDDETAQKLLGQPTGKSEAWVIAEAAPESRVWSLRAGVTQSELAQRIGTPALVDLLTSFNPQVGDVISVPAGTVHALGGGIVTLEVQQPSDATFRIHDWDRPRTGLGARELHPEQALKSVHVSQAELRPLGPRVINLNRDSYRHEVFSIGNHFTIERFFAKQVFQLPQLQCLTVLVAFEGSVRVNDSLLLQMGETALLPPGDYQVAPVAEYALVVTISPQPVHDSSSHRSSRAPAHSARY